MKPDEVAMRRTGQNRASNVRTSRIAHRVPAHGPASAAAWPHLAAGAQRGRHPAGERRTRVRPMSCTKMTRPRRSTQREGVVQQSSGPPRGAPVAVVAHFRRLVRPASLPVFGERRRLRYAVGRC